MIDRKLILNGNFLRLSDFAGYLSDYFSDDIFSINDIRLTNVYENGKKLDAVESVTYSLTNLHTHSNFNLKVLGSIPLIAPADFARRSDSGEEFFMAVNAQKVVVKPYAVENGKVKVSISCEPSAVSLTDEPVED